MTVALQLAVVPLKDKDSVGLRLRICTAFAVAESNRHSTAIVPIKRRFTKITPSLLFLYLETKGGGGFGAVALEKIFNLSNPPN